MAPKLSSDHDKDRETLKTFLCEYSKIDDKTGNKQFNYREQLTNIAHQEQVSLVTDLDYLRDFREDLAEYIFLNTRRYVNLLLDLVKDLLPDFKERPVIEKDTLDVYTEHRSLLAARNQNAGEQE